MHSDHGIPKGRAPPSALSVLPAPGVRASHQRAAAHAHPDRFAGARTGWYRVPAHGGAASRDRVRTRTPRKPEPTDMLRARPPGRALCFFREYFISVVLLQNFHQTFPGNSAYPEHRLDLKLQELQSLLYLR